MKDIDLYPDEYRPRWNAKRLIGWLVVVVLAAASPYLADAILSHLLTKPKIGG
jgi:hypothetical protein